MNKLNLSRLRDCVHQYLDDCGILHCFNDCYTFTESSNVLLFTVYEPIKSSLDLINSIQHLSNVSSIHILNSSQPCLYYVEIIVPIE